MLLALALAQPLGASAQEVDLTSLTLKQAEALLQTKNRELQAARRAVEAAGAGTLAAGAHPNPTLSLGVSQINLKEGVGSGSYSDKIVDSNVRIDQVIERGDKRDLRLANARSLESASNADLSDVGRQQRLALRSAYYDLLFAQDKVDIARDTISLFEGSVRAAELRLKAGDIAQADVARLRVDALRAQNDARAAEADQRRAQLALAYMIGAEGNAIGIRAVDPWPSIYSERPTYPWGRRSIITP
jgi:cobalt-zinc-cadmium efflux system outer membrane protein